MKKTFLASMKSNRVSASGNLIVDCGYNYTDADLKKSFIESFPVGITEMIREDGDAKISLEEIKGSC